MNTQSERCSHSIFAPDEGRVLQFLGDTIIYKFDPAQIEGYRFFELLERRYSIQATVS